MIIRAQFGVFKPIFGEFGSAIGHVLSAKNAHLQHLFWRELGLKIWVEVLPDWLRKFVGIPLLHLVVYGHELSGHT